VRLALTVSHGRLTSAGADDPPSPRYQPDSGRTVRGANTRRRHRRLGTLLRGARAAQSARGDIRRHRMSHFCQPEMHSRAVVFPTSPSCLVAGGEAGNTEAARARQVVDLLITQNARFPTVSWYVMGNGREPGHRFRAGSSPQWPAGRAPARPGDQSRAGSQRASRLPADPLTRLRHGRPAQPARAVTAATRAVRIASTGPG
jgi:hypothetical protein